MTNKQIEETVKVKIRKILNTASGRVTEDQIQKLVELFDKESTGLLVQIEGLLTMLKAMEPSSSDPHIVKDSWDMQTGEIPGEDVTNRFTREQREMLGSALKFLDDTDPTTNNALNKLKKRK